MGRALSAGLREGRGEASDKVWVSGFITRLVKKSNLDYGAAGREGNTVMHLPAPQLRSPGTPSGSPHLSAPLHSLSSDGDHVLPVGTRSLVKGRQAGKKAHVN